MIQPPTDPGNSQDRRRPKTPWWEKAAVVVALGLLIVNICQMRATETAANASQKQVHDFEIAQSAHLVVVKHTGEFTQSAPPEILVRITIKNAGSTVATNISVIGQCTTGANPPEGGKEVVVPNPSPNGRSLAAQDTWDYVMDCGYSQGDGPSSKDWFINDETISWKDVWGNSYGIGDCLAHYPPGPGPSGGKFWECNWVYKK